MIRVSSSSESINPWTPEVEGIIALCKEWLSPVQQYQNGVVTCTYTHLSAQCIMMQENWSVWWEVRNTKQACSQTMNTVGAVAYSAGPYIYTHTYTHIYIYVYIQYLLLYMYIMLCLRLFICLHSTNPYKVT
jgi:hypothetical protein